MTDAKKPVVVQLKSGAEYGLPDAATAKKVYPNEKIVRYQDGSDDSEPKKSEPKKDAKK